MRRPILMALAVLSCALLASAAYLFLRAYRGGITVRLGESKLPALAPPPAGVAAATPADAYTNEQLHALLQDETSQEGIRGIVSKGEPEAGPSEGFLGPRLGMPGTRAQAEAAIRQLARMRRSVEANKKPNVPLEGDTVPLLAQPSRGGGAIETAPPQTLPAAEAPQAGPRDSWSGAFGGTQVGTLTISDPDSWARVWSGVSQSPPPAVDFSRQQVVAVFLGPRPSGGFRAEISRDVKVLPAAVVVRYREIEPAPGRTPPEGATAPYAMRAIARTSLPVRFERAP